MINLHKKLLGEVPFTYNGGGGGKSGGGAVQQAPAMTTTTTIGDELEVGVKELDTGDVVSDTDTDIKKKGTRGLQIPLAKDNTTTAATTGVQV